MVLLFPAKESYLVYLVVVLLAITGMIASLVSIRRTLTNDGKLHHHDYSNRLSDNKKAYSIPNSSFSKILPPADILNGYQSCDEFKSDLVKFLTLSGENFIQTQVSYSFPCFRNDIITYYNSSIDTPYSQQTRRTHKKETSYGTNNRVPNIQEQELIQSDGKYIYAASGDRILVSDLNGKVVVNFTLPYANNTSEVLLNSIFINDNILTAFASLNVCGVDYSCNSTFSAFYFNFNQEAKAMTLVKQHHFSNFYQGFDVRQIGNNSYILAEAPFGDLCLTLGRCNENFKDLSEDEYVAEALASLNSTVIQYASAIVAKLSKEGATSTCNNIIKMFNYKMQPLSYFYITKVFAIGLSGISKKAFFLPFLNNNAHISKNAMLISTGGQYGDTFLLKFSLKDLVITPTSVGTLDGYIRGEYGIDLYNGYYRIATSSDLGESYVTVLQEQNSLLNVVGRVMVGAHTVQSVRFYKEKGFFEDLIFLGLLNLTSPTNPSITSIELLNSPHYNMHPIEDGNYIISIDTGVGMRGIAVYLFQATNKCLKQVGELSEVNITELVNGPFPSMSFDAMWDYHTFRYLSQSRKLIIPIIVYGYSFHNDSQLHEDGKFQGFFVYDVDLVNGVTLLGNVTHDFAKNCKAYPPRSMVFNGDLITVMGKSIKMTSNVTALNDLKWELKEYCGFS